MSKFLGVWGGGPPGHYLDATPVEVKSGQNLVFPLKKGRVSLCGKRGLDLHRGRKFVSVRGGPHPTPPFFCAESLVLMGIRCVVLETGPFRRRPWRPGSVELSVLVPCRRVLRSYSA